jgi:beta-N-acetylhexosaminidase
LSPQNNGAGDERPARAVIFGCAGSELNAEETRFFRETEPLGLILFARNIETPQQLTALIAQFCDCASCRDPLILIDQEGGRVARLGPPHWRKTLPAAVFGDMLAVDRERACMAARLNAEVQAAELAALGINVNCTPVLDLARPETHDIIGDRAYGSEPDDVALLARAVAEAHAAHGVVPVIKHIPGHGRATVDSHLELPRVTAPRVDLEESDFAPFRALADMPVAMTAHIVFSAIDADAPATLSAKVVSEVIRGHIGFDGLLMSDDLCMKALDGDFGERTVRALAAGCDVVLHCSGDMAEMEAVAAAAPRMAGAALARLGAVSAITARRVDCDIDALRETAAAVMPAAS